MSSHRFITRSVTTALAATAFAASSALAGPPMDPITPPISPQEQQVIASRGQSAPTPIRGPVTHVTHVEPTVQAASGSDFNWGDAGLGAGVVGGLLLVAFGSAGLVNQRRTHIAH
jgi:hypothetical protein